MVHLHAEEPPKMASEAPAAEGEASEGTSPAHTLILDFQPPDCEMMHSCR